MSRAEATVALLLVAMTAWAIYRMSVPIALDGDALQHQLEPRKRPVLVEGQGGQ